MGLEDVPSVGVAYDTDGSTKVGLFFENLGDHGILLAKHEEQGDFYLRGSGQSYGEIRSSFLEELMEADVSESEFDFIGRGRLRIQNDGWFPYKLDPEIAKNKANRKGLKRILKRHIKDNMFADDFSLNGHTVSTNCLRKNPEDLDAYFNREAKVHYTKMVAMYALYAAATVFDFGSTLTHIKDPSEELTEEYRAIFEKHGTGLRSIPNLLCFGFAGPLLGVAVWEYFHQINAGKSRLWDNVMPSLFLLPTAGRILAGLGWYK